MSNQRFDRVTGNGWQRGLANLLRGIWADWFGRWRWLKGSVIWIAMVNGVLTALLLSTRGQDVPTGVGPPEAVYMYTIFAGMFVGVGVVIVMQSEIVGEKRSGTAAWVLSKPVSRIAFVLAKALGNGLGLLVTAVVIPAAIAYFLLSRLAFDAWLPVGGFAAGMLVLALNMWYWLTLTVMVGTFYGTNAPVIAIPLGLLFGQQYMIGAKPILVNFLPWSLASPLGPDKGSIAGQLILGITPSTWLPVIVTALSSLVFLALALWRFEREEL